MGAKLKVAGLLAVGAMAGALTTIQLTAVARSTLAPLPLAVLPPVAGAAGGAAHAAKTSANSANRPIT